MPVGGEIPIEKHYDLLNISYTLPTLNFRFERPPITFISASLLFPVYKDSELPRDFPRRITLCH